MYTRPSPDTPLPILKQIDAFKMPKECKRVGRIVWKIDEGHFLGFRRAMIDHFCRVSAATGVRMYCVRGETRSHHSYIVKRVPCETFRIAVSCLREFDMQTKVYSSAFGDFVGSDVCPEPIMCGLVREKKKWAFILVSERVVGHTIKHLRAFRPRWCFGMEVRKDDVVNATCLVLRTLWTFGFAHNDTHDGNIIYDPTTKTAKIVDYETCVQFPTGVVQAFRADTTRIDNMGDKEWVAAFNHHYLRRATRALKELEEWCLCYLGSDDTVSNNDSDCVEIMKLVLPDKMWV